MSTVDAYTWMEIIATVITSVSVLSSLAVLLSLFFGSESNSNISRWMSILQFLNLVLQTITLIIIFWSVNEVVRIVWAWSNALAMLGIYLVDISILEVFVTAFEVATPRLMTIMRFFGVGMCCLLNFGIPWTYNTKVPLWLSSVITKLMQS